MEGIDYGRAGLEYFRTALECYSVFETDWYVEVLSVVDVIDGGDHLLYDMLCSIVVLCLSVYMFKCVCVEVR